MNDYEILLMLDPELAEERQTEIVTRARELIEKNGGTWLSHDLWGRRRLAYEIDHKPDGTYHLFQFDAQPATLDEVTRVLKITDGVMRHLATRRVKGGTRTAPPPLPTGETPQRHEREDRRAPQPPRAPAPAADEAAPAAPRAAEAESQDEGYAPATEPASEGGA